MRVWRETIGVCAALFACALASCAFNDWHAPHTDAIVALLTTAIALGTWCARRQLVARSAPLDHHGVLSTRSGTARTLVFAALGGLVVGTLGSYAVVVVLDSWTSLVVASIVGSTWIGALPLFPIVVHRMAERKVKVGLDAVAIGGAHVWLRDIERAEARDHSIVVIRRDGSQLTIACATERIARDFAELITTRAGLMDVPPMLARQGRTLATWRAELASPDYRTALVSLDDAERVLLSGAAARDERIGAALVLASLGARERVAKARDSFVDPAMRNVLDRIVDDTLDDSLIV